MKNLFIVMLKYLISSEEIEKHMPAHQKFLLSLYARTALMIASGPQIPSTGRIWIVKAHNREEVEEALKNDPLAIAQLVSYEIHEFEPTNMNDWFDRIMYKDL